MRGQDSSNVVTSKIISGDMEHEGSSGSLISLDHLHFYWLGRAARLVYLSRSPVNGYFSHLFGLEPH